MTRCGWRLFCGWALLLFLPFGLTACTAFKPKVEPVTVHSKTPPRKVVLSSVTYQGVPCYLHEVRWPEESLSTIARWYTGNEGNARILAKVTPNLRTNDLRKGDVVFIPQELSRRTDPMTRSYARRYKKAPTPVQRVAPKEAPADDDDFPEDGTPPAPYGPRTYPE
jgi:hypothetical protein